VVWIDSWPSIAGAGCGLICVGTDEEWVRKVYALQGLRGVERQVGLTRGTRWPAGSSAGRMVARNAREVVDRSRCRVAAHNRSLHAGFTAIHHKTGRVTWLSHKTKTGGSAGGDASRLREGRSPGICLMVLQRHIPQVPLVGVYPSLGCRGILVFRLSPYILRGERMAAISRKLISFCSCYFPFLFFP
jgi:hypothetical protein